ncbi:16105_t:CDS:2 [Gigaspora margarita]|uniref:16105_t:CDS:1 n=1 Tax=Gigaspora margarita TaxID=4874 RepID=A0ABN7VFR2_GIGMA|nr:16105_t:CDS:2 [Gigaspora margarita]
MTNYDYIVVGGCAVGLSTAYNLGKACEKGEKVLVLEKFMYFNQAGSSGDFVRMFRTMYSDIELCKLALKARDLWIELEKEANVELIKMMDYQDGPEGNLTKPIEIMKQLNMEYQQLSSAEIMERYPFRNLPSNFIGVFAKDNGIINVFLTLRILYKLAQENNVELRENEEVTKLELNTGNHSEDRNVIVTTIRKNVNGTQDTMTYSAKKVIITAGAYVNNVIKTLNFQIQLCIWEMVSMYFTLDAVSNPPIQVPSMWFQFQDETPDSKSNLFYGFPEVSWGPENQTRIAVDYSSRMIYDPDERHTGVSEYELQITSKWVEKHCIGVQKYPVFQGTCLMPNVRDNNFVLDFAPEKVLGPAHKNIIIFTAGWAFKFVPLLGKCLSQLAINGCTEYDISNYNIDREGVLKDDKDTPPKHPVYKPQPC